MHTLRQYDLLIVANISIVIIATVLLITIFTDNKSNNNENMLAEVPVPRVAVEQVDPAAGVMRPVAMGATKLPAELYAALNYGDSSIRRVDATSEMFDDLDALLDNSQVQPEIGAPAVFYLKDKVSMKTMSDFNGRVMAATSPMERPMVVTISQYSTQPRYVLYAFIDKGINWGAELEDFCDTPNLCIRSDIYFADSRPKLKKLDLS